MSKSMFFLIVLFVVVIGYPYLSLVQPNLVTAGVVESAAVVAVLFYVAAKLRGTTEKTHHYSSPKGTKKEKSKRNPFLLKK